VISRYFRGLIVNAASFKHLSSADVATSHKLRPRATLGNCRTNIGQILPGYPLGKSANDENHGQLNWFRRTCFMTAASTKLMQQFASTSISFDESQLLVDFVAFYRSWHRHAKVVAPKAL
jgi:hypothetical protein